MAILNPKFFPTCNSTGDSRDDDEQRTSPPGCLAYADHRFDLPDTILQRRVSVGGKMVPTCHATPFTVAFGHFTNYCACHHFLQLFLRKKKSLGKFLQSKGPTIAGIYALAFAAAALKKMLQNENKSVKNIYSIYFTGAFLWYAQAIGPAATDRRSEVELIFRGR